MLGDGEARRMRRAHREPVRLMIPSDDVGNRWEWGKGCES